MRATVTYSALVGIPIALLFLLLRTGRGLEAPPAVAGEWRLQDGRLLRIEQSGVYVEAELEQPPRPLEMGGRLARLDLRVRGDSTAGAPCRPELRLRFAAGPLPEHARGALRLPPGCAAAPVQVQRARPAEVR